MKNIMFASAICVSTLIGVKTYVNHADFKGLCFATAKKEMKQNAIAPVQVSLKEKENTSVEGTIAFHALSTKNTATMHDDFMDDHGTAIQSVSALTLDEADVELNQDFYSDNAFVPIDADSIIASDVEVNDSFQAESAKPNFVSNTAYSDQFMNDFFHANNK